MTFWQITSFLLDGFRISVLIFFVTLIVGLPLGLPIAMCSMSKFRPLKAVAKVFVWVIRGVPLMLQIFIIYYVPGLVFHYQLFGQVDKYLLLNYGIEDAGRILAVLIAARLPAQASAAGQKVTLNVYNWGEYIDLDVLDEFESRYPNIPVVVMLPLHHGTEIDVPEYVIGSNSSITEGTNPTTGKTFREYVDAIREVAAYYSFIVLDAYSYSNLSPMTEIGSGTAGFFKDGLHLNAAGGKRLARWMYPQLEAVYEMFYDF